MYSTPITVLRFISKASTVWWSQKSALECQSDWDTEKRFTTVMYD